MGTVDSEPHKIPSSAKSPIYQQHCFRWYDTHSSNMLDWLRNILGMTAACLGTKSCCLLALCTSAPTGYCMGMSVPAARMILSALRCSLPLRWRQTVWPNIPSRRTGISQDIWSCTLQKDRCSRDCQNRDPASKECSRHHRHKCIEMHLSRTWCSCCQQSRPKRHTCTDSNLFLVLRKDMDRFSSDTNEIQHYLCHPNTDAAIARCKGKASQ